MRRRIRSVSIRSTKSPKNTPRHATRGRAVCLDRRSSEGRCPAAPVPQLAQLHGHRMAWSDPTRQPASAHHHSRTARQSRSTQSLDSLDSTAPTFAPHAAQRRRSPSHPLTSPLWHGGAHFMVYHMGSPTFTTKRSLGQPLLGCLADRLPNLLGDGHSPGSRTLHRNLRRVLARQSDART